MKRALSGFVVGAIALAWTASAQAQVAVSVGAPGMPYVSVGTPYASFGYSPVASPVYLPSPVAATTYYGGGLVPRSYVATVPSAVSYYSSGYQGYAAPVAAAPVYAAPAYPYPVATSSVYVVRRPPFWRARPYGVWGW